MGVVPLLAAQLGVVVAEDPLAGALQVRRREGSQLCGAASKDAIALSGGMAGKS
jgi:hypothetical protein